MYSVATELLENTQERKLRDLEERVDQLSQQVAHALQLLLDLKHGEGYGDE